jgi:hypothetical protein
MMLQAWYVVQTGETVHIEQSKASKDYLEERQARNACKGGTQGRLFVANKGQKFSFSPAATSNESYA